jgi:hypothetical protein
VLACATRSTRVCCNTNCRPKGEFNEHSHRGIDGARPSGPRRPRPPVWGLGVLYGLLLTRETNTDSTSGGSSALTVSSIASVSGGSIANGAVAERFVDVNAASPEEVAAGCRDAVHNLTFEGMIFFARHTNPYAFGFVGAVVVALGAVWFGSGAGRDCFVWLVVVAFVIPVIVLMVRLFWSRVRGDKQRPALKSMFLILSRALMGSR